MKNGKRICLYLIIAELSDKSALELQMDIMGILFYSFKRTYNELIQLSL